VGEREMERIITGIVAVLLVISLVINGVLFSNYLEANSKLEEIDQPLKKM